MNPESLSRFVPGSRRLSRRDFLRLGTGVATATALGGLGGCEPGAPLRIAASPWAGYVFMFLARDEGWLPEGRVELVETAVLSDSVKALAEGRVEAAGLTLDEVLRLRDQGTPLSIGTVFDVSAGADALVAKPAIKSLADLKGRRIAVEDASLGTIMLAKVLEAAGLERTAVSIVPLGSDHVEAWERGQADAIITYEPGLSRLEARGLVRLFDSRSLPQVILDVLAVRTEAMERHAEALRALIAGHFRALRLWRRNPIDTAYRLSSRLGVQATDVGRVFKGLDLPDAQYNLEYLSAPAPELTRATTEIAEIMHREGLLVDPLTTDRLFVSDYLPGDGP
jgi:NitT/TauT family transport system substrate-binding protein